MRYMDDPSTADAVIADRALRIAAAYGDAAFFDRVVAQLASSPVPELAARYRNLLPLFRDPKVSARALDYMYGDRIRTQDAAQVIAPMFADPLTRPAAWAMAKQHWAELEARSPGIPSRIMASLAGICDPAEKKEVEEFFAAHPPKTTSRSLARAYEAMDACIALKGAQGAGFGEGVK
jgi:aminopeptidase N